MEICNDMEIHRKAKTFLLSFFANPFLYLPPLFPTMRNVVFLFIMLSLSMLCHAQIEKTNYEILDDHPAYPDYYPCQNEESGLWGYVDKNNEWAIRPLYDATLYETNGGMYPVQRGGKWGFVGVTGAPLTDIIYDAVQCEIDYQKAGHRVNLAAVRRQGKWAFIDVQGRTVTPFKYDEVLIMNGQYIIRMKDPNHKEKMRSGILNADLTESWQ